MLSLGVLFAGIFQLEAWHYSLILGPGAGGAGRALQPPLPPARLWGRRAGDFGNQVFVLGGKTFLTAKTRENTDLSLPAWDGVPFFHTAYLFLLAPSCGQASFL